MSKFVNNGYFLQRAVNISIIFNTNMRKEHHKRTFNPSIHWSCETLNTNTVPSWVIERFDIMTCRPHLPQCNKEAPYLRILLEENRGQSRKTTTYGYTSFNPLWPTNEQLLKTTNQSINYSTYLIFLTKRKGLSIRPWRSWHSIRFFPLFVSFHFYSMFLFNFISTRWECRFLSYDQQNVK